MRKIVFLLIMVLAIVGCYIVSVEGVQSNLIQIASYDEVKAANKQLDTQISELNRKNTTEYESKRTALTTAVKNYKDKKEKYEALAPTVQETEEQEPEETTISNTKPYDVDFLWTIVGNYATETGISIDFTFVKSTTASTSSSDYFTMSDINFTVSGTYNSIIEFIYDIEDDDRLGFEIKNFKMSKGGSGVQATFSAIGVPINNENLTTLTTQSTTDSTNTALTGNTTDNTVAGDTTNAISNTTANTNAVSTDINTVANTAVTNTTTNTTANVTR